MTRLRQRTLEELQRRNYSQETARSYIHAVKQFAEYFGKSPQELGAEEIRRYQLYLLNEKKYSAGTVKVHMSALRFFYKKVVKRRDLSFEDLVYPKKPKKLRVVLSPEEVTRLIEARGVSRRPQKHELAHRGLSLLDLPRSPTGLFARLRSSTPVPPAPLPPKKPH